jgi:hypothetical protein
VDGENLIFHAGKATDRARDAAPDLRSVLNFAFVDPPSEDTQCRELLERPLLFPVFAVLVARWIAYARKTSLREWSEPESTGGIGGGCVS